MASWGAQARLQVATFVHASVGYRFRYVKWSSCSLGRRAYRRAWLHRVVTARVTRTCRKALGHAIRLNDMEYQQVKERNDIDFSWGTNREMNFSGSSHHIVAAGQLRQPRRRQRQVNTIVSM